MKRKNRENCRFVRFSSRLFIFSCIMFVIGIVGLNSYESTLNINCQNLGKDISIIESDIDGLDMRYIELKQFQHIEVIAQKRGYHYLQNTEMAVISKKSSNK